MPGTNPLSTGEFRRWKRTRCGLALPGDSQVLNKEGFYLVRTVFFTIESPESDKIIMHTKKRIYSGQ
jgi:hypothetical protein